MKSKLNHQRPKSPSRLFPEFQTFSACSWASQPLVSIIVPIYNVKKYLVSCIESLCAQTYQNLEIFLVDDGSTDGCGEVCEYYATRDQRFRVMHKKNGGISSARNMALDQCEGEWVSFVDSDDVLSPVFVEVMVEAARSTGSLVSTLCHCTDFNDDDPVESRFARSCAEATIALVSNRKAVELMLYQQVEQGAAYKVCHCSVVGGIRFPEGVIFEDVVPTCHMFEAASSIALVNASLYGYRHRENSILSAKFSEKNFDALSISRQLVENIHEFDPTLDAAAASRAFSILYSNFLRVPSDDTATLRLFWDELLKYRDVVAHDKNPLMRRKNRIGAVCSYLGMRPAHAIGALYRKHKRYR